MTIEPQTYVASFAALIAIIAASFAWRSSHHAKRNADKAVGDLEPFVEVFQVDASMYDDQVPQVSVRFTCHNRRAVLVHKLAPETVEPYIAYRTSIEDEHMATAGIVDVILGGDDQTHSFDPPLRLEGNVLLNSSAPRYEFLYNVTDKGGSGGPSKTSFGLDIEYSLEGLSGRKKLRFDLPVHRWAMEEFRAKFRKVASLPR